jgi:hypothetical protein
VLRLFHFGFLRSRDVLQLFDHRSAFTDDALEEMVGSGQLVEIEAVRREITFRAFGGREEMVNGVLQGDTRINGFMFFVELLVLCAFLVVSGSRRVRKYQNRRMSIPFMARSPMRFLTMNPLRRFSGRRYATIRQSDRFSREYGRSPRSSGESASGDAAHVRRRGCGWGSVIRLIGRRGSCRGTAVGNVDGNGFGGSRSKRIAIGDG